MKNTIHKGRQSTIVRKKKKVIKTMHLDGWTRECYELYKEFSAQHDYCVTVTDYVNNKQFEMEHLDIVSDAGHLLEGNNNKDIVTNDLLAEIARVYTNVYADCLNFSKKFLYNRSYFIHTDLHIGNLVLTKTNQIKLIDPNSFKLQKNFLSPQYLYSFNRLMLDISMSQNS